MGNTKLLARASAEAILKELKRRSGFRHLIKSIELEDNETYLEIKEEIAEIISSHYENHVLY